MTAVQKFRWFYKYFKSSIYGGRTSEKSMSWIIKDEDERNEFLNTFYDRCPCLPNCGESPTVKYYLLKSQWEVVRHILDCVSVCKKQPTKFPKYIWWTIRNIRHIKEDRKYYMNR